MDEHLQSAVNAIHERLNAQIVEFRGQITLLLGPENIVDACKTLRDEFNFDMLVEETAVDYWPQEEPRFNVSYQVRSLPRDLIIGLRVPLNGNFPSLPSITGVYCNANWFERELFDMFGIQIENHPDLRRILMPEDWQGHPLRKDYPLGYEEVQFTFNTDEVNAKKHYAKE